MFVRTISYTSTSEPTFLFFAPLAMGSYPSPNDLDTASFLDRLRLLTWSIEINVKALSEKFTSRDANGEFPLREGAWPSFNDMDAETQKLRNEVISATQKLNTLVVGPRDSLKNFAWDVSYHHAGFIHDFRLIRFGRPSAIFHSRQLSSSKSQRLSLEAAWFRTKTWPKRSPQYPELTFLTLIYAVFCVLRWQTAFFASQSPTM